MRDNIILNVIGKQRVGKTTQTRKEMLCSYIQGKKCLIFDPNDEVKLKAYTSREIIEAARTVSKIGGKVVVNLQKYVNEPNKIWPIFRIAYDVALPVEERTKGLGEYSKLKGFGIRRISPLTNASAVDVGKTQSKIFCTSAEKMQIAKDILSHFRPTDANMRNGFVLLDDINNYVLNMHGDTDFVGTLMNINHRGVDIVIHYHDPMQVPPVLYRFGSFIRLHKTVDRVKPANKVPYEVLKLAETIIDEHPDPRFFVYVDAGEGVITGPTEEEFQRGAMKFLNGHKAVWQEFGSKENCYKSHLKKMLKK